MNQQRVLIYSDYHDDEAVFFDVSCLTDAEVLRLATHEPKPLAYGSLHFFEESPRTIGDVFMALELGPERLEREDLSWAEKVVAAMPQDKEWQRDWARYQKRLEELRK